MVITGVAPSSVTSVVGYHAQTALSASATPVPTDLPAAQAVTSLANIPGTRNDARNTSQTGAPSTNNDVIVDPQTDAIVFRSLDPSTGAVIDQVPAQALLRQRAYEDAQAVQALIAGKNVAEAEFTAGQSVDATT